MKQSSLEKLQAFAKKTGRQIVFTEEQYPLSSYRQIPRYKRTAYIPNDETNQLFFVLFSDPYHTVGEYTIFCGIYFKTNISKNVKLNFRPKNIVDKLNPFLSGKTLKFNERLIDSKLVTTGNNEAVISRYFRNSELQRLMMKSFDTDMFLNFSVNETPVDFVPELKDASHFALVNPQEWVFDERIIESWFHTMEQIQTIFQKKEAYV